MVTLEKIPEYLIGTCVLHNICILRGDMIDFEVEQQQQQQQQSVQFPEDRFGITGCGKAKRETIMNNLFMRINM